MPNFRSSRYQYTKEELEEAVKQNTSILGTMRTLRAFLNSGSLRKNLTELIKDYGIDTSHFLGMGWNKGLGIDHKGGLAKKLIRPEDKRRCSQCSLTKLAKEFYRREKAPRAGDYYEKCKICMKIRGRLYFYLNRDRQIKLAIVRRLKYTEEPRILINKLKNRPWLIAEKFICLG